MLHQIYVLTGNSSVQISASLWQLGSFSNEDGDGGDEAL